MDCQDCGKVLRVLAPEEAQKVAAQPYNYVLLCAACRADRQINAWREGL